jgi:hypothetical protein
VSVPGGTSTRLRPEAPAWTSISKPGSRPVGSAWSRHPIRPVAGLTMMTGGAVAVNTAGTGQAGVTPRLAPPDAGSEIAGCRNGSPGIVGSGRPRYAVRLNEPREDLHKSRAGRLVLTGRGCDGLPLIAIRDDAAFELTSEWSGRQGSRGGNDG